MSDALNLGDEYLQAVLKKYIELCAQQPDGIFDTGSISVNMAEVRALRDLKKEGLVDFDHTKEEVGFVSLTPAGRAVAKTQYGIDIPTAE